MLPLFTKLANAQSPDLAHAECVAAIRENYLHNPAVGLENALHACWEAVNPHGIRAVFALAHRAKGLDRMENIERDLGEKWIMWMEGDHSRGLLPLYAELCLEGDPTNFYKTRIANYSSYISMWENTSPSRMLLECLELLGESGQPPLPSRKTISMISNLIDTTLQPDVVGKIVDRLKPEQYPRQLSQFLDKFNEQSTLNSQALKVLLKAPGHRLWENMNVWTTCLALGNAECLDHLAMNLRPAAFENYKNFGEKMFAQGGSSEERWRASLAKRQSIEDAVQLDKRTVEVGAKPRQSRL